MAKKHPVQLLLAMAIVDAVIDAERERRILDFEAKAQRLKGAHPEARAKTAEIAEALIEEKARPSLIPSHVGRGRIGERQQIRSKSSCDMLLHQF